MGFKSFEAAQCTLAGIERMHMLRKGQLEGNEFAGLTATEQFYALVLYSLHLARFIHLKTSRHPYLRHNRRRCLSSSRRAVPKQVPPV